MSSSLAAADVAAAAAAAAAATAAAAAVLSPPPALPDLLTANKDDGLAEKMESTLARLQRGRDAIRRSAKRARLAPFSGAREREREKEEARATTQSARPPASRTCCRRYR